MRATGRGTMSGHVEGVGPGGIHRDGPDGRDGPNGRDGPDGRAVIGGDVCGDSVEGNAEGCQEERESEPQVHAFRGEEVEFFGEISGVSRCMYGMGEKNFFRLSVGFNGEIETARTEKVFPFACALRICEEIIIARTLTYSSSAPSVVIFGFSCGPLSRGWT